MIPPFWDSDLLRNKFRAPKAVRSFVVTERLFGAFIALAASRRVG